MRELLENASGRKLGIIFLSALLLTYAHGAEEVLTGFQYTDSFIRFGAQLFNTSPEAFYWVSHLSWWVLLPTIFILFRKKSVILPLLALFGLVFFIEIHHVIKALMIQRGEILKAYKMQLSTCLQLVSALIRH